MNDQRQAFLETLLQTDTPSGYETPGQQAWIEYVSQYADTVRTDEYGNAVAVLKGGNRQSRSAATPMRLA